MKNFYTEHKGYLELKNSLIRSGNPILANKLLDVVSAAIDHGIDLMTKNLEKDRDEKRA